MNQYQMSFKLKKNAYIELENKLLTEKIINIHNANNIKYIEIDNIDDFFTGLQHSKWNDAMSDNGLFEKLYMVYYKAYCDKLILKNADIDVIYRLIKNKPDVDSAKLLEIIKIAHPLDKGFEVIAGLSALKFEFQDIYKAMTQNFVYDSLLVTPALNPMFTRPVKVFSEFSYSQEYSSNDFFNAMAYVISKIHNQIQSQKYWIGRKIDKLMQAAYKYYYFNSSIKPMQLDGCDLEITEDMLESMSIKELQLKNPYELEFLLERKSSEFTPDFTKYTRYKTVDMMQLDKKVAHKIVEINKKNGIHHKYFMLTPTTDEFSHIADSFLYFMYGLEDITWSKALSNDVLFEKLYMFYYKSYCDQSMLQRDHINIIYNLISRYQDIEYQQFLSFAKELLALLNDNSLKEILYLENNDNLFDRLDALGLKFQDIHKIIALKSILINKDLSHNLVKSDKNEFIKELFDYASELASKACRPDVDQVIEGSYKNFYFKKYIKPLIVDKNILNKIYNSLSIDDLIKLKTISKSIFEEYDKDYDILDLVDQLIRKEDAETSASFDLIIERVAPIFSKTTVIDFLKKIVKIATIEDKACPNNDPMLDKYVDPEIPGSQTIKSTVYDSELDATSINSHFNPSESAYLN